MVYLFPSWKMHPRLNYGKDRVLQWWFSFILPKKNFLTCSQNSWKLPCEFEIIWFSRWINVVLVIFNALNVSFSRENVLLTLERYLSVIRQKGECYKKTKHATISEKRKFLFPEWSKKCLFLGKFDMLCFLVTSVLRFALLPYCWRIVRLVV